MMDIVWRIDTEIIMKYQFKSLCYDTPGYGFWKKEKNPHSYPHCHWKGISTEIKNVQDRRVLVFAKELGWMTLYEYFYQTVWLKFNFIF